MRNNRWLMLLALLSTLALSLAQTGGQGPSALLSDGTLLVSERERRIRAELLNLPKHPWAGDYYYGDGLGANVSLLIAPEAGFVFTWDGCLGRYDWSYGNARVAGTGTRIELLSKRPNRQRAFQGIALALVPIVWGDRHYLIPMDEL